MRKISKLLLIVIIVTSVAYGQKTEIGKPAPEINIEKWIYPGIQVPDFDVNRKIPDNLNGKIIVLDFWFTKCAPCVASIPHLNSLAKRYPDIVFLSISFEFEGVLKDFLSENILYYPVGSDVSEKTIKAFGVSGYPQTFVITGDGRIAWKGSPFQLDEDILDFLTGKTTLKSIDDISDNETNAETPAYSFTITENTTHDPKSSYSHTSPWEINIYNNNLESIIKQYYKVSSQRIIVNDTTMLNKRYNITLKADKNFVTAANCPEILKYFLVDALDLQIKEVQIDTVCHSLTIINDSLSGLCRSNQKGTGITFRFNNWEARGISLDGIKKFLEDKYGLLIYQDMEDKGRYDIILPVDNFEKARNDLSDKYGIGLIETRNKLDFLEIGRKKEKF